MSYAKSTSFLHQECNLQSITSQDLVHADHAVVACNMTNMQACIFAVLSLSMAVHLWNTKNLKCMVSISEKKFYVRTYTTLRNTQGRAKTYHRIDDKRKYCVNEELYSFDQIMDRNFWRWICFFLIHHVVFSHSPGNRAEMMTCKIPERTLCCKGHLGTW